ncbi:MAG: xanthine dehydrogenase family protein molybdopterin-binding subunit [Pirellulaceae bacterium]|nr:xanthine dehydrogenase family protein molybdopterin-binding subunit [Pirellulaceae bacterium]
MKAATSDEYKILGTRPIRHDGADKVTGKAKYGADVQFANLAHGKILRSPHAHARIKSIDTSAAEKVPGVFAVITANDFPDPQDKIADLGEGPVTLSHLGSNVMARGKVLYKGHAVAAVAATSTHVAEQALNLIQVDYEILEPVLWVLDAMAEDAPLLHENVFTDSMGEASEKPSNIEKHLHFEKGDIEQGFAEADIVIEREFKTASVHQGYIEPHVATADWNEDGQLRIWTSTQGSFTVRHQTAELVGIPLSRVTVYPCEIGGGFGGKIAVYLQPVAALLSRKSGRPVKLVMQRDEVFEGTGPTPGSFVRVKLGAKNDGTLTAGKAWIAFDAGAFPGGPIGPGCMCVFSCYDLPHATVDGYNVCNNKPKTQAYRAPGSTHVAYATENVLDEIAGELDLDPLDLRLKNAVKEGSRRVDGPVYPEIGCVEVLEAVKNSEHWNAPLEGPYRGRGLALGFWFNCGLKSSATANVNTDGTVTLIEGSTDIGGSRTSLAMQLAETLGLTAEEIHPQVADTDSVGYTDVTGGSRVTFATGLAVCKAGEDIQKQMRQQAAVLWDCDANEIEISGSTFSRNGNSISFQELAAKQLQLGEPIVGRATVAPDCSTNGFGAHIADVEVDPETGKTTVLRYTAIQDAGKAIHPSYVEGQMQGGAVQGIGWALNEEYFFGDAGDMKNASFLDYRMPTCLDVPMIETIIVEVPNPDHPFGVRGVGETPIVPPPAAITIAIHNATGVYMRELPASPPRLWKALQEA